MKEFELQALLAGLKQIDVDTFETETDKGRCPPNCFVLNKRNELTHLSVVDFVQKDCDIDFSQIVKHPDLINLRYSSNQLAKLPSSIANLDKLTHLDLSENQLSVIPASIADLKKLSQFLLFNNPMTYSIKEVERSLRPQELISYLLSVQDKDTKPLNEAKMLVVGDERVGKTSLINRLVRHKFDVDERSTLGIDIQKNLLSNGIRVNIWDFAGQEITHQTHQFFLSSRSLYVYVLDSQKEDNDPGIFHWLNVIKTNGGDSPIIIVVNKRDLNSGYIFDINRYKRDFNIVDVLYLSCQYEDHMEKSVRKTIPHSIADLTQSIEYHVSALEGIKFPLPTHWASVKSALEDMAAMDKDYIQSNEYANLCVKNGVDNEYLQNTLLTILNQIGTVVAYKEHRRLSMMKIINPLWVTNGVYKIIRSPLINRNAILQQRCFDQIFKDDNRYKSRHFFWLMDLLNQFELSFSVDDSSILIPSKLSPNQPAFDLSQYQRGLNFRYRYQGILKKSVISQLIVKMKDYISTTDAPYWQRGVFLQLAGSQAVVISDEEKETITIAIDSNNRAARELLGIIRHTLRSINGEQLKAVEEIPLLIDGQLVGYESYNYLIECEQDQERVKRLKVDMVEKSTHRFLISDLLEGYRLHQATRFDHDKLTRDIIAIATIERQSSRAIFVEHEDLTNDRFRNALIHRSYNIGDQSRGGESESSISSGERDFVVRNKQTGVTESAIETLVLKSVKSAVIEQHINKLVRHYDAVGDHRNFIVIYAKSPQFDLLWQKYKNHFDAIEDVSGSYGSKQGIRVGLTTVNHMEILHILIDFYSA